VIYFLFANFDDMKSLNILFLIGLCNLILFNCNNRGEKEKQKSTDLVTIRTLGLAYLEEFNLEEAEKEFLRFIDLAPDEKLGYANLGLTYLRMAKYPEAEKELKKAIEIDSGDPDIRLILATVYKMNNEPERAIAELKDALSFAPDHIKILYEISELYSAIEDKDSQKQRENYILNLVEKAPGNLPPRLNLTDILIRKGEFDKALEQMEIINRQFPDFPKEAVAYYDNTLSSLRKKDKENAIVQFTIFHNYLKVTSPYQSGIVDLKGPGGSLIGFPVITFDRQLSSRKVEDVSLLDVIRYSNASSAAGLEIIPKFSESELSDFRYSTHVATCDYDTDGDIDLYAGSYDHSSSSYNHYLFNNEMGKYTDVTKEAGLKHSGIESSVAFADFDNDGFPDLFVMKEHGDIIYRNTGKGTFIDITNKAKAGSRNGGQMALFFDLDHDGDLDLFEILENSNLVFRNNADGTFEDISGRLDPLPADIKSRDAVFGDFDDDEDIDFIIVSENSECIYYSNQRQGVFKNIAAGSGLTNLAGAGTITTGDYNNDGYLDLFIGFLNGRNHSLYRNLRNGSFELELESTEMFSSIEGMTVYDASFLDFNNDGFQDLFVAGEPNEQDKQGIRLFYNNGTGSFTDVSKILPPEIKSGRQISLLDYNDDGDLDAIIAGLNGGVYLLRNDGGNNNHFITMNLVGLKAGSAKNNHFGIGAKVEVRAGDLYQTIVVADPNIHFGLGNSPRADIIRIRWTNGVPQNIFLPGSDQALIEEQTLKGSCPFLYTWNGDEYIFVKDILWRSALGMPTGIMGGTTSYAFADASDDYLKIPGEFLEPREGIYSVQVTSELWETIYLDKMELVAVDHPDTLDIFVPEQFGPPPFPGLKILTVKNKHLPVSAMDSYGNNVLPFISHKDDKYLTGFKPDKYQGITDMWDLIIDLGKPDTEGNLFLFMNGWIFPTDASINVAISQSDDIKVTSPLIQVLNRNGDWETVIDNLGFPMGKDKTVIADLSGKFLTKDYRVRIRTNMEIYWDHIFFSGNLPDAPVVKSVLTPQSADLHYRGFSRLYRKGGRYGPHWFDYDVVDKNQKWRDLTGNYTRFGDVLPLITESDNKYIITNAGDETTVEFGATALPALPQGWKRDFLIRSVGWVKDGDLNTAFGNTVTPLPFHGMNSYPPSETDIYPDSPELQKYNREYNTRIVTAEEYINAVRGTTSLRVK